METERASPAAHCMPVGGSVACDSKHMSLCDMRLKHVPESAGRAITLSHILGGEKLVISTSLI